MDAAAVETTPVAAAERRRAGSASVQMNTRIDRELKRAGDAVLEQIGLTPTEAVRCLYELVLRHRDRPQELRELLEPSSQEERAAREAERERRLKVALEGATMCQWFYDEHGITPDPTIANVPYDRLRELALMDEYGPLDDLGDGLDYGSGCGEVRSA